MQYSDVFIVHACIHVYIYIHLPYTHTPSPLDQGNETSPVVCFAEPLAVASVFFGPSKWYLSEIFGG